LKPIWNSDCNILGRSEAKDQNNAIVVTVRLQSFGTRLRAVDLIHLKLVRSTALLKSDVRLFSRIL